MVAAIATRLRSARLGHALMEAVPGSALEVGRIDGPSLVVGPVGYPGAEVLPSQHRGAIVRGLATRTLLGYVCALGLDGLGGELYLRLLLPPGSDLGTGVVAVEEAPERRLVMATTLCAHHAVRAARSAESRPTSGRGAVDHGGGKITKVLVDLRVEARHDPVLGTTVLAWTHRPHPAALTQVEDAVRAAAAACVVEELLLDLRAG